MTTPADETQRVRGYILSQANKLSIPELVEKVRRDTAPLREAGAAVPADRFTERPGPESWSAAEVYTHILRMNEAGARAIEGILDCGALPPRIDDTISGETSAGLSTAEDYWHAYHQRRERLLARVLASRGDEYLTVNIHHTTFGDFSWREWLLFMRVHDLDHLRQLQAIAARFAA
jgi:hypothetical protein